MYTRHPTGLPSPSRAPSASRRAGRGALYPYSIGLIAIGHTVPRTPAYARRGRGRPAPPRGVRRGEASPAPVAAPAYAAVRVAALAVAPGPGCGSF